MSKWGWYLPCIYTLEGGRGEAEGCPYLYKFIEIFIIKVSFNLEDHDA